MEKTKVKHQELLIVRFIHCPKTSLKLLLIQLLQRLRIKKKPLPQLKHQLKRRPRIQ
jgi:hypothetical protein